MTSRTPARILYVDDDEDLRLCVGDALCRAGYAVTVAASASDALTCLERDRYDLVLADHWMPDATGPELLARAAAAGVLRDARTSVVTSDLMTAAQPGVELKPVGEEALLAHVTHRLAPPPRRRRLRAVPRLALAAVAVGLMVASMLVVVA